MITTVRNPVALWPPGCRWLETFWDVVLPEAEGRVLQVLALSNVLGSDSDAVGLLREHLRSRGERLEVRYVHAGATEPEIDFRLMADRDLVFVGRTLLFHASAVGPYANALAASGTGRFMDRRDGRRGRAVRYGSRVFQSHQLDLPLLEGRCDVDYALLTYRQADIGFDVRRMVGFCGVTATATWMLTRIMTDPIRRRRLAASLRTLLPWNEGLRPEERFDVCIRFVLDGEKALIDLLNEERFDFQVVAATIGSDVTVLLDDAPEVELRPDRVRGGGRLASGTVDIRLLDLRFRILRALVEAEGPVKLRDLCLKLGLLAGGESAERVQKVRGRVVKAVHDLNKRLSGDVPALQGKYPVRHGRKGYWLEGMKAAVRKT